MEAHAYIKYVFTYLALCSQRNSADGARQRKNSAYYTNCTMFPRLEMTRALYRIKPEKKSALSFLSLDTRVMREE